MSQVSTSSILCQKGTRHPQVVLHFVFLEAIRLEDAARKDSAIGTVGSYLLLVWIALGTALFPAAEGLSNFSIRGRAARQKKEKSGHLLRLVYPRQLS